MITSAQALGVLASLVLLSGLFAVIYQFQWALIVDHQQRLKFLKANLVITWIVALASILILGSNSGHAIGNLLPANEAFNPRIASSTARILAGESSWVSFTLFRIYLVGLAVMLIRFVTAYIQMRKILLCSSEVLVSGRAVRTAPSVTTPFSFGFFNPQIFVPSSFLSSQSAEAVYAMLVHEETHVLNRDPQWKLISVLTRVALFFNPLAFYLHRKLELEMEIECDRLTLQKTNLPIQKYGRLLIDTAAPVQGFRSNLMFTYMSDTNLKGRILAMKAKTMHRPVLSGVLGVLVLAASVTAVAATSGVAKLRGQYLVSAEVRLDGKLISAPRFVLPPNEPASVEMRTDHPEAMMRMMLTAGDATGGDIEGGIDLKMALDYKTGERNFRASPRIVVLPGEEGTVTVGSADGTLEMKVKAERQ